MLNTRLIVSIVLPIIVGAVLLTVFFKEEDKSTEAPLFTITDIDGAVFKLSEHRGKVVVIEFMATWCRYCKAQIEELKLVNEHFTDSSTVIVSISVDPSDNSEALVKYRDELEATWIFAQGYKVGLNYGVKALPTTVIIDHEGKMRFRHEGVVEASKLEAEISQILNELKG
ncbi:MAG: TlpA disulfide reductase family protein [Candidatus Bathyarchaeia archaeon]